MVTIERLVIITTEKKTILLKYHIMQTCLCKSEFVISYHHHQSIL